MNKRNFGIFMLFFVLFQSTYAQSNLLNAKTPSDIGKKTAQQLAVDDDKPLPYGYIDDRDVVWSKVVWEYIDLNQRVNLPMYYPVDTVNVSMNRRSLFDTLLRGIKNDEITEIYDDSYFTRKLTKTEINALIIHIDTTDAGITKLNQGETDIDEFIQTDAVESSDIEGYKIKGLWYFDKRQGELQYRLLAIAPFGIDVKTKGSSDVDDDVKESVTLFWVWFPDARETLHNMKVFNHKNSAHPISFDHVLNARRFSSIIYRTENIYGNRDVAQYVKGNALYQVLESEKIKNEIRNKEIDMWNY